MDWDQVNRAAYSFMRGMLGSGYIPEHYQSFADELTELLKGCEVPDPEVPTHDAGEYRDPSTGEPASVEVSSPRGSMTFAQAEALLVEYQREKQARAHEWR